MYHYVREYSSSHPNFRFLDFKNFCKQLDYFDKNYGFVTKSEWQSALRSKNLGEANGKVILTFDDALSCHYKYIFPELKKRNLWGTFYVPTQPYSNSQMLDVHRIHLLCGAFDGSFLLETLLQLINENMIPDKKKEEFRNLTYKGQDNYKGVSEFKRILNYFISYEHRKPIIDKIADSFNYKFEAKKFYLTRNNLIDMIEFGNIIGSHTVTHPVMSKISFKEQREEIKKSFTFLENSCHSNLKTYCHPYGGFHSFNEDTITILNSEKVDYSFNVEARDIENSDLENNIQYLPRYDCNHFPFGTAS